jgi:hypothetical protein
MNDECGKELYIHHSAFIISLGGWLEDTWRAGWRPCQNPFKSLPCSRLEPKSLELGDLAGNASIRAHMQTLSHNRRPEEAVCEKLRTPTRRLRGKRTFHHSSLPWRVVGGYLAGDLAEGLKPRQTFCRRGSTAQNSSTWQLGRESKYIRSS